MANRFTYCEIGSYIGDSSLILVDDKGGFYLGDHAGVIDKSTDEKNQAGLSRRRFIDKKKSTTSGFHNCCC